MGGNQQSMLSESYTTANQYVSPAEFANLKTIPERLRYFAETTPKKEAVVFLNTMQTRYAVTFKELYDNSQKAAKSFLKLGIKQGEYIVINIGNCPEWLYAIFGAMMAKIRPVCLSFTYQDGSDIVAMMEKLKRCSCIIFDTGVENEKWNILSKLLDTVSSDGSVSSKHMGSLRYLICHDFKKEMRELKSFENLLNDVSDNSDIQLSYITETDVAILVQTSGSTGIPKAVVHTHKSLLKYAPVDRSGTIFTKNQRYYCDRPFLWIGGFPLSLFIGQTRITLSGLCPLPEDGVSFCMNAIRQENCQEILCLPPVLHEMIKRKDECTKDWPLQTIVTGGQPITATLVNGLVNICKFVVVLYGSTECSISFSNVLTASSEVIDYSSGYPVDGHEVKLIGDDGQIVPIGTRGEIYIKSEAVFKEYLHDQKQTQSVFTEDGWYKTGDIGTMLADGALIVEGRKANNIISGGVNIVPELLEHDLRKCPGVDAAVIVPVPDDVMFQVICACVKPRPGCVLDEDAIRQFCKEQHADKRGVFSILPKYFLFLDKLPETNTGKISRPELTRIAKEKFAKTK